MGFPLSLHTAPRLVLLGLLFLQDVRDHLGGQLEWEADIPSELLGLASFGICNAQKVDTGHKGLSRTDEITHALLVLRMLLNEVLDGFVGKHEILILEGQALQEFGPDLFLQNDLLVGCLLSRTRDDLQTIPQNGVDLALVVEGEHEQALRQVEVHARKLAVMELGVLRAIRQVDEQVDDFFTTLRG